MANSKKTKTLTILLRIFGVSGILALVAVFVPVSWMAAAHRWLGLGEMPTGPLVEYLARSLSAFYAFLGALFLMASTDLERFRPLVRFLGVAVALLSGVFMGIDLVANMPWWWAAVEGPPGIAFGALVYFLAR
jgi:hypothetical protein